MNTAWNNKTVYEQLQCGPHSVLGISQKHYKHLAESIYWQFKGDEPLILTKDIGYTKDLDTREDKEAQAFSFWVYNEKATKSPLNLTFMKASQPCCGFEFSLDFTGWRTCWVLYDRDMTGSPAEAMDSLIISPPRGTESGELYFSEMITVSWVDPRHPTADFQVPNINPDTGASGHWLDLFFYWSQAIPACVPAVREEIEACCTIEKRYRMDLLSQSTEKEMEIDQIRSRYAAYGIVFKETVITGNPIASVYYYDIIPWESRAEFIEKSGVIDLKNTLMFLKDIALSYNKMSCDQDKMEIEDIFIGLIKHLLDQGFAAGSSLGTTHHSGYVIRYFYEAAFLMKDVLSKASLLKPVTDAMAWYAALNRIFSYERASTSNIDILNTFSQGMMATILMMENADMKTLYLTWYVRWVDYCLKPAPGLRGTFKPDGSAFHHRNMYPAYALDGMKGITPVIYYLSRTLFRLPETGHSIIRKAVLAMRLYSNKRHWLVAVSGRHPKGEGLHTELSLVPFRYMALAGTPDGLHDCDVEMASAYLRLVSEEPPTEDVIKFQSGGAMPESAPEGHFTMNYGCLTLHRRGEWLVGIKGYSRYLWGHETYSSANLFGRYMSYGQIQVLSQGKPVTNRDSGFKTDGFNWNRWPGTTTIQLPFEALKSDVRNVDEHSGHEEMLLSDQVFAGGLHMEGRHGMFGMTVHEHDKYDGSHYLNLSVYCFDERIICLGSNIRNTDEMHVTQTTLFQNAIETGEEIPAYDGTIRYEGEETIRYGCAGDMWLVDNKKTGYYIPGSQRMELTVGEQHSRSQDKDEATSGVFACAVIDHGSAPDDSGYEYAMLIEATKEKMIRFSEAMNSKEPVYTVLQKDSGLHAVTDHATGIVAYSVFDSSKRIEVGSLRTADNPCMVMIRENDEFMKLSVVDPDLRLYRGIDKDQYNEDGTMKEVSVYSRTWFDQESQESELNLCLKGQWVLEQGREKVHTRIVNDETVISFRCQHALPIEISLRSVKK